ncbi:glycosyltransferase [Algoriphagus marinus]|uniref:glycosyltransferase n=1 Tax=Algoriphagus marinus TaxID=1925762 RepID=UPI00094BAFA3|nr:glycosyltransferase [Algoriphagus marinus]
MEVIVVIVTYGSRFHFLEQVVQASILEGASKVWIFDNGSSAESKQGMNSLSEKYSICRLFTNEENIGTAGAYARILDEAIKLENDFYFWFLDDDNLPTNGSLLALKEAYALLSRRMEKPVLYSYRGKHWKDDALAVTHGVIKGPRVNSFCGFDILSYLGNKFSKKPNLETENEVKFPVIKTEYGPYGGLFSHVSNFKKIGLPKKEFFVYADDHEYTIRFSQVGVTQFLIYTSQIEDLDMSYKEGEDIFSPNISLVKLYYSFRNTTFFYKQIKTNKLKYKLNHLSLFFILIYWGSFKFFKNPSFIYTRLKFLFSAINLGEKGEFSNYSQTQE